MTEFSLIDNYFRFNINQTNAQTIKVPAGDDAAVIAVSSAKLITNSRLIIFNDSQSSHLQQMNTEMAIEQLLTHSKNNHAQAKWLLLNLILQSNQQSFITTLSRVLQHYAQQHQLTLIGGDTSQGQNQAVITLISTVIE